MKGKRLVMLGVLLLAPAGWAAEGDFSTLEEQMTGEEFERAGLNKLDADELRYLNNWLKREEVAPEPRPETAGPSSVTEEQMGLRPPPPDRVTVESRIDGEFNGWSGRTLFRLQNGQVWQQIGGGSYYFNADSPEVRIEPKSLGSWKLYVKETGRSVKVKRIR